MMKKATFFFLFFATVALSFYSCKTNTDDLWDSIHRLDGRVTSLEELCKQMNGNISSLQKLVQALQDNNSITKVTPIKEGDKTIGYTISFTKGDHITIYHGEKGDKGEQGDKGNDGSTPVVGVKQHTDGTYYWTLNGDWLRDQSGNMIKAEGKDGADGEKGDKGDDGIDGSDGKDGITPLLEIRDGRWYLSIDSGQTWSDIGQATGNTGKDGINGDNMFSDIDYTSSQDFVTFTLSDGAVIKLPTWYAFDNLKQLCEQMNSNISSIQSVIETLQQKDAITNVEVIKENGKEIGYKLSFEKHDPITIYHGKDGKNGADGEKGDKGDDGIDGTDGKDGITPIIGVKQHTDGTYYWTLNGDWLRDQSGNMIKAIGKDGTNGTNGSDGEKGDKGDKGDDGIDGTDGKDGITPLLEIRDGRWYLSIDSGQTWTDIGQATGADGTNGDSLFQGIDYTSDQNFVTLTLADGTVIKLPTWYAFDNLKQLCEQMNSNISSIQSVIEALQQKDAITNVEVIKENGKEIGYKLSFEKHSPITIYHGKDGEKGDKGDDGIDGSDGKDGITPIIGVKQDTDGIYYWTLNGEWLRDQSGNMIKAEGKDGANGTSGKNGVTPQLKIEDGDWHISYDKGSNWSNLGKATGTDGDSFFQDVTEDDDYVYLNLKDKNTISIPKHKKLSITFSETGDIRVLANQTYSIQYTLTGATDKTVVKALAQDGFRAVVKSSGNASGVIEVTTPRTILSSEVLVFVSDGEEHTIMRSINFIEGVINITNRSYTVSQAGGKVNIDLSTNIYYTVEIPDTDKSWISTTPTTRSNIRNERIALNIQPNNEDKVRYSIVKLIDNFGIIAETIQITQRSGKAESIYIEIPGTLNEKIAKGSKITEVKISGKLNSADYDFLKTLSALSVVDLSDLTDSKIPSSAFEGSSVTTVLLPSKLITIGEKAFYKSSITSIQIPPMVEAIGKYAFAATSKLKGDVIIPDKTLTIDDYAFQAASFDGTLQLGRGLKRIGNYTFADCKYATGDLSIPDNVTALGIYAFQNSTFTGSLAIGNGLQLIPKGAFNKCSSFKGTILIGKYVTTIQDYAFNECSGFTGDLIIPDYVETIGEYAFHKCTGFTGCLTLGASLSVINKNAFNKPYTAKHSIGVAALAFSQIKSKALVPPRIMGTGNIAGVGIPLTVYNAFGEPTDPSKYPTHLYIPIGTKDEYCIEGRYSWEKMGTIEEIEL